MNMEEMVTYIDQLKKEYDSKSQEHSFGSVLVLRLIEHGVLRDEK